MWNDFDRKAALRAVALIPDEDQPKLAHIAADAKRLGVRVAALKRIHDQRILHSLANLGGSLSHAAAIRILAARRLREKAMSPTLTTAAADASVAATLAVTRIKDDFVLAVIAADKGVSIGIRLSAVRCISDDTVLVGLCNADVEWRVVQFCIDSVTTQSSVFCIAQTHADTATRVFAASRLEDKRLVDSVAIQNSNAYVRVAMMDQIGDTDILAEIAEMDLNAFVRKEARLLL